MDHPTFRDLLILVALAVALLSGGLAVHTTEYSGPVVTDVEAALLGASLGLATVGLAAALQLWVDRPAGASTAVEVETEPPESTETDSPAGNRGESTDT